MVWWVTVSKMNSRSEVDVATICSLELAAGIVKRTYVVGVLGSLKRNRKDVMHVGDLARDMLADPCLPRAPRGKTVFQRRVFGSLS